MKISALILAALPFAALAEPISLKALAPGMTRAQLEETYPKLMSRCMKPERSANTDEVCGYVTKYHIDVPTLHTFAGVNVLSWTILMKEGKARTIMVSFAAKDFAQAEAAVTERWGVPNTRTESAVQNRMGATFDQVETRWIRDESLLRLKKRAGKLDESSFYLTNRNAIEEAEKATREAAKAGASDM